MRKLSIIFLFILSLSYSPNMYSDYLYGFGNNSFSQMGLKSTAYDRIQLNIGSDWSVVKKGGSHFLALKTDGTLWGWGDNYSGELGHERYKFSDKNFSFKVPVQIGKSDDWAMIECGNYFSIAIKKDGSLWIWGKNENNLLAMGEKTSIYEPTQFGKEKNWAKIACGYESIKTIKKDGSIWEWGKKYDSKHGYHVIIKPTQVGNDNNWQEISTRYDYTIALKKNGSLWAWGHNNHGKLGLGHNKFVSVPTQIGSDLDWKKITCGKNYAIAQKHNGSLWAWGENLTGQLGIGRSESIATPTQIGSDLDWKDISCGYTHTLAIKNDGSLWSWGDNRSVQISKSSTNLVYTPKQISNDTKWNKIIPLPSSSILIESEGKVWQTGRKSTTNHKLLNTVLKKPTLIESYVFPKSIQANSKHSLLLTEYGRIEASGLNFYKQIPNFYYENILYQHFARCEDIGNEGIDARWATISSNDKRMVGIKLNGTLWECGNNTLTTGRESIYKHLEKLYQIGTEDTWQQVACSDNHTVAIKDNGSLWAWGNNKFKQLGIHTTDEFISEPTRVGNDLSWKKVICNNYNTVALKNDGSIWEIGIGLSSYKDRYLPVQMGDQTDWKEISLSRDACFAIKNDGSLWAWGRRFYGNGRDITSMTPVQIGTSNDWSKIAAGESHYLAIKKDGTLWGWGENSNYQLGLSHNNKIYKPTQIGTERGWTDISCSRITSLALKKNEIEVDDKLERLDIKSYPNPARNEITLSYFLEPNMYGSIQIEMYDILGRQVKKIQNLYSREGENIKTFNIQDLPNGMYYYKFIFSDKTKSGIFYIAK